MGQLSIQIELTDKDLARALAEGLGLVGGMDVRLRGRQAKDRADAKVDMMWTDRQGQGETIPSAGLQVGFADRRSEESLEHPPYRLYPYEDVRLLKAKILFLLGLASSSRLTTKKTLLFLFLSDSGGTGVSSLALAAGKMLHRLYGGKALYINLTPFPQRDVIEGGGNPGDESGFKRLLYALMAGRQVDLNGVVRGDDELDVVAGPDFNKDWLLFRPPYLEKLQTLAAKEGYAYLLVDVGDFLHSEMVAFFPVADALFFVTRDGHPAPDRSMRGAIRVANGIGEEEEEEEGIFSVPCFEGDVDRRLDTDYGTQVARLLYSIAPLIYRSKG